MLKGWYYNRKNGQRLLSLAEIAQGCGCSPDEVEQWFGGKRLLGGETGEKRVDAGEVVAFLVRKSMPVPPTILPPHSLKLLFISGETDNGTNKQLLFEALLHFFRRRGNILIDKASPGKFADLSILTFVPDVVIYLLTDADATSINTLTLLGSFPECRTILVVADDKRRDIEQALSLSPPPMIVSDRQTPAALTDLLKATFE